MYKFILVSSEEEGHSSASAKITSDEKSEQEFRNDFLLVEGMPAAELLWRNAVGDTVVETFSKTGFSCGDFSISTTTFNDFADILNRSFDTCTG